MRNNGVGFDFPPEYVVFDLCKADCKRDIPNGKGELSVRCPICSDKHFDINVAKGGTWKCFKGCADCPGHGGGGILDFYALYFPCNDRKDAKRQIMRIVEGNWKQVEGRKAEHKAPKKTVKIVNIEERDRTYREFLGMLTLANVHHRDLTKRGFSEEDIRKMNFKSIPQSGVATLAKRLYERGCVFKGVPGFYMEDKTPKINCFGSGYYIPYYDAKGRIMALQCRRDVKITSNMSKETVKKKKSLRYRWFTSSGQDGGCSAGNIPFYGIPGKGDKKVVYVTEGGLKAAAAQSMSDGWFTAIPGTKCFEALRELFIYFKTVGVEIVVDAFDADRATNPQVAADIEKMHSIAREYGFEMKTWYWGTEHKGVDDFLYAKKKEKENHAESSEKMPPPPKFGGITQ